MSVRSPTAGTWSISQWRPDNEFETDRAARPAPSAAPRSTPRGSCSPARELGIRDAQDVESYFAREVLPHAPDAWIDHEKTKVGCEIPFNRHFYVFKPPRDLAEIDADLKVVTDRILTMIRELST